ncbi:MAG: tRNA-dihydrouridine synthase, partial [Proteobacteria bacterium]|nr:tRNA-dihydrouridine synthase [Pseudomonadota bacterium]
IGRACYGRPWFVKQVMDYLRHGQVAAEPPAALRRDLIMKHYEHMLGHYGIEAGLRIARKHLGWYSKGYRGGAEFRAEVNKLSAVESVHALINRFFGEAAPEPLSLAA